MSFIVYVRHLRRRTMFAAGEVSVVQGTDDNIVFGGGGQQAAVRPLRGRWMPSIEGGRCSAPLPKEVQCFRKLVFCYGLVDADVADAAEEGEVNFAGGVLLVMLH